MKNNKRELLEAREKAIIDNFTKVSTQLGIISENLDAKYVADDLYKFGVKSQYVIGFQGREDVLFFKTEAEALAFVQQKPKNREYLGLKT